MQPQASMRDRLSDPCSEVRAAALSELLQSGADASPFLREAVACLGDPSESLRLLALVVLGRIGAPAAGHFPSALAPPQPDSIRAVVASLIAAIGAPAATSVRELCRCLTSPDKNLRAAAAVALAKIGEPSVSSLRIMLRFTDPETVAAAVESLTMIGPPAESAIPELESLAAGSVPGLQLACAAALASITGNPERGLSILLKALEAPDRQVRKTAVEKISKLGKTAHPAIPNLLQCTLDPDETVRSATVLALGRLRAPHTQTLESIVLRLSDAAADVRYASAIVLAAFGANARPALPHLRAHLQDPEKKVAECVAGAIKMIELSCEENS